MNDDLNPPAFPPSPNRVEAALNTGWGAVKARPWFLSAPLVILLPLFGLILPAIVVGVAALAFWLIEQPSSGGVIGLVVALLIGLPLLLLVVIAGTGYAAAALRVVRGEPVGAGDLLAGFGRLPGIAFATAITGAGVAAITGVLALGAALFAGATRIGTYALVKNPQAAELVAQGVIYLFVAALSILAIVAACYLFAGLAQWPYLLLVGGLGARDAVAESWRLMRGRRLDFVSLWFATTALNVVGLLALGLGALFTLAIAAARFAAFYDRLEGDVMPEGAHPASPPLPSRTPMAAWVVDSWIALRLTALVTLLSIVATLAPIISLNRTTWSPYGPAWILAGFSPFVIVPVVYMALGRALGRTPGQRIVGAGWGRFRWLAAVMGVAVLVEVVSLSGSARRAPFGILALAVGYETARQVVADLPAGYHSAPNNNGASDGLDLPSTTPSDMIVSANYRITDTGGVAYLFTLRRYFHVDTAEAAVTRMHGPGETPEPALGPDAFTVRDEDAGVTRIFARAGDTIIAGEALPAKEGELKRLVAMQLGRLDTARAEVERVFGWLPVPTERLEDQEAAGTRSPGVRRTSDTAP